jgi:hypothetical protein
MRLVSGIIFLAACLAVPAKADVASQAEREGYLEYVVAAAREPGDRVSDAAMLRLLVLQDDLGKGVDPADMSAKERSLRAEAAVLRVRLAAGLGEAEWDQPELLARGLGCSDVGATPDVCALRSERLGEIAGDNAYYHLVLAAQAWRDGDSPAYLAHMQAAAAADHYRSPYVDYYAGLHARFKQVPDDVAPGFAMEDDGVPRAASMAMALSAAYAMPNYQGFVTPCREAQGELKTQCLAIAQKQLRYSQTPIETSLAASVVEALGDDGERAQARRQRNEAFWLIEEVARVHQAATAGTPPIGYEAYFEDYGTHGELEAARRLLVANQRPTTPPDGWTSAFSGSARTP